jgi:hypothetical protein
MRAVLARSVVRKSVRSGSDYHAPSPEQMRGAANNWFHMHTFGVVGWFPAESNTTYETELARLSKELGWDSEQAHLPAPELCTEERRYWAWNDNMFLMTIGFFMGLLPFMPGNLKYIKGTKLIQMR